MAEEEEEEETVLFKVNKVDSDHEHLTPAQEMSRERRKH
jgi:hypothetical protein